MVEGSYELHDGRWRSNREYPEWVSRCYPNEKASLIASGAAVRPSFRDSDEFQSSLIGRVIQIREVGGDLHADVIWGDQKLVETAPIWAMVEVHRI